jgi:hypothetical protein
MMSREAGAVGDQPTEAFQNNEGRKSARCRLYERAPFVRHHCIVAVALLSLNFLESFLSARHSPQNSRHALVADLVALRLEERAGEVWANVRLFCPPCIPDSGALLEECEMFCVGHLFTAACSTDQPPPPWLVALSASRSAARESSANA